MPLACRTHKMNTQNARIYSSLRINGAPNTQVRLSVAINASEAFNACLLAVVVQLARHSGQHRSPSRRLSLAEHSFWCSNPVVHRHANARSKKGGLRKGQKYRKLTSVGVSEEGRIQKSLSFVPDQLIQDDPCLGSDRKDTFQLDTEPCRRQSEMRSRLHHCQQQWRQHRRH